MHPPAENNHSHDLVHAFLCWLVLAVVLVSAGLALVYLVDQHSCTDLPAHAAGPPAHAAGPPAPKHNIFWNNQHALC